MYQLTPPNEHLDFGFGITSETYYGSAKLLNEQKKNIQAFQLVEMPISFLYRHSIELALKSLIIIFHKKLQIPYEKESFESKKPKYLLKENGDHFIVAILLTNFINIGKMNYS